MEEPTSVAHLLTLVPEMEMQWWPGLVCPARIWSSCSSTPQVRKMFHANLLNQVFQHWQDQVTTVTQLCFCWNPWVLLILVFFDTANPSPLNLSLVAIITRPCQSSVVDLYSYLVGAQQHRKSVWGSLQIALYLHLTFESSWSSLNNVTIKTVLLWVLIPTVNL